MVARAAVGKDWAVSRTKVLLIDEHALMRTLLHDYLQQDPTIEVIGTAVDGDEGIQLALEHTPDVVVISVDLPDHEPFKQVRRIAGVLPEVRLVFLASRSLDRNIDEALSIGARGFLTAADSPAAVTTAIRGVARGEVVFSDEVRSRLVLKPCIARPATGVQSRLSTLSRREFEVLQHLGRGMSAQQIAPLLQVGNRTVEKHAQHIMHKLDIHDRVELVRYTIREQICSL